MIEIEFIGTGGQGSVVAGRLLADAAARAGYKTQAFSAYGAQRRGGNVESYVRLSSDTIRNHSKIYGADLVILMDKALLDAFVERGQTQARIYGTDQHRRSTGEVPGLERSQSHYSGRESHCQPEGRDSSQRNSGDQYNGAGCPVGDDTFCQDGPTH